MPDADRRTGIHARENPAGGPASAPLTPKAPVLECLHEIRDSAEALDRAALLDLSQSQNVPLAAVQSSFSFYPRFSESVPPESIGICDGPACRMAGGPSLAGKLHAAGRPTHTVPCQGRCADAPAAVLGRSPGSIGGDGPAPAFVASIEEGAASVPSRVRKGGGYAILRFVQGTGEVKRIIDALKESGLAGMGGAGFPTGQKWEIVRQVRAPVKYVVANADEGEPGTFKDRWILERFPHTFLEGLLTAMRVIGAEKGFVYLRDEYWDALSPILRRAIEEARHARHFGVDASRHARQVGIELRRGAGCYVCGEETALLESIEGKRGEPRLRPPYPGQAGLWGRPDAHQQRRDSLLRPGSSPEGISLVPGSRCRRVLRPAPRLPLRGRPESWRLRSDARDDFLGDHREVRRRNAGRWEAQGRHPWRPFQRLSAREPPGHLRTPPPRSKPRARSPDRGRSSSSRIQSAWSI